MGPWRNRFGIWSGLSESNRHLNLGKSARNGVSTTYEALSGALSKHLERSETLNGPTVGPTRKAGWHPLCLNRERVQDSDSGLVSLARESVIVSRAGDCGALVARLSWAHSPRLQPLHPFLLTTNVSNKSGNLLSLKGNSNELKTLDSGTVLAQWTLRFPAFD